MNDDDPRYSSPEEERRYGFIAGMLISILIIDLILLYLIWR
jgi:tetrahydromethanopterin S-methyltransferase subunit F